MALDLTKADEITLRSLLDTHRKPRGELRIVGSLDPDTAVFGKDFNHLLSVLRSKGIIDEDTLDDRYGDPLTDSKGNPLTRSRWPEDVTDQYGDPLTNVDGEPLQGWKDE